MSNLSSYTHWNRASAFVRECFYVSDAVPQDEQEQLYNEAAERIAIVLDDTLQKLQAAFDRHNRPITSEGEGE